MVKRQSFVCLTAIFLVIGTLNAQDCSTEPPDPSTNVESCPCGQRKASRIIGGTETIPNEFPWQAALKTIDDFQFCGGSLIAKRWVMTAAHCVDGASPSDIIVGLGEHDLTDSDAVSQDFQVSRIIMGNYDYYTIDNDIALLELSTEVFYDEAISPVCLPFNREDTLETGDLVTVSGWGVTDDGNPSDVLMNADLNYYTACDCRDTSDEYYYWVTKNMVCAFDTNKGGCYGDSGGPLVASDAGGNYYIHGIVSWGYGCATSYPTVFAKVTNYLDWIEAETGVTFCIPSA